MGKIGQTIKLIVLISALTFLVAGKVAAVETNIESADINPEGILKQVQDDSVNPPLEQLVPKPTPSPAPFFFISPIAPVEEEYLSDNRSWTRFKYRTIIKIVSERYNLDPQLIYATIMTESEGNEYAYRYEPHLGEASLCMGQILVSTARALGFEGNEQNMYRPDVCIDLVGKYHRNMLDTFGELTPQQLAVAYNSGSPWGWPVRGHLFRFNSWYQETVGG